MKPLITIEILDNTGYPDKPFHVRIMDENDTIVRDDLSASPAEAMKWAQNHLPRSAISMVRTWYADPNSSGTTFRALIDAAADLWDGDMEAMEGSEYLAGQVQTIVGFLNWNMELDSEEQNAAIEMLIREQVKRKAGS